MTTIEWTEETWNPTTGCDRVSDGCDNCYALTMARRLKAMGDPKYQRDGDPRTSGPGFGVSTHTDTLGLPLRWKRPRRIFVNSMSDLFHADLPEDFIAQVWTVMAATPQHTYQILTKRHARMRSVVRRIAWRTPTTEERRQGVHGAQAYVQPNEDLNFHLGAPRVLPNVWLGVSVEDQKRVDLRIPALLDTPAAVRWISAEPLLGPLYEMDGYLRDDVYRCVCGAWEKEGIKFPRCAECGREWRQQPGARLDWVVTGGESGPGARPAHPDWFRSLRDQCQAAGVAYLHKQNGAWVPESALLHRDTAPAAFLDIDGVFRPLRNGKPEAPPMARGGAITVRRVGKKAAGRELDGRTWDEYPEVAAS